MDYRDGAVRHSVGIYISCYDVLDLHSDLQLAFDFDSA